MYKALKRWTKPEPTVTVDFSDRMGGGWGGCGILNIADGGKVLRLYGFYAPDTLRDDCYVILSDRNGATSRYRLGPIKFTWDGTGMWFADATFAPRPTREDA